MRSRRYFTLCPGPPVRAKTLVLQGTFDIVSTDASVSTGLSLQNGQVTGRHGRLAFYARKARRTVAGKARCSCPLAHPVSTAPVLTRLSNK